LSSSSLRDPQKLSEDALREAALRYLDQRDASVHQLRLFLRRRVDKYGTPETQAKDFACVESILERLCESKVLDDARFARAMAESQRRRGGSSLKVRQKLSARGLASDRIEEAMGSLSDDPHLTEEQAATTYARKRRLAEKYDLKDAKQREKALAALARQGFSFEIARRVLGL
jgi:regulatory protein